MTADDNARRYESWYHTPRGDWIATQEVELMRRLLAPATGDTLLDIVVNSVAASRSPDCTSPGWILIQRWWISRANKTGLSTI